MLTAQRTGVINCKLGLHSQSKVNAALVTPQQALQRHSLFSLLDPIARMLSGRLTYCCELYALIRGFERIA